MILFLEKTENYKRIKSIIQGEKRKQNKNKKTLVYPMPQKQCRAFFQNVKITVSFSQFLLVKSYHCPIGPSDFLAQIK